MKPLAPLPLGERVGVRGGSAACHTGWPGAAHKKTQGRPKFFAPPRGGDGHRPALGGGSRVDAEARLRVVAQRIAKGHEQRDMGMPSLQSQSQPRGRAHIFVHHFVA